MYNIKLLINIYYYYNYIGKITYKYYLKTYFIGSDGGLKRHHTTYVSDVLANSRMVDNRLYK